jgi:hypothetical protein
MIPLPDYSTARFFMREHNALTYILTYRDIYLSPVYFIILAIIVIYWRKKYYSNHPGAIYLFPAFIVKMVCCVAMACLIHFYYGYGDTFNYFTGANEIRDAFLDNPYYAYELTFKPGVECSQKAMEHFNYLSPVAYDLSNANNMIRISGIISILGMGCYIPMAFILGTLGLTGVWNIYKVFYAEFPKHYNKIAITCLFAPSAMLWSAGVIKDTLCIFGLGLCISAMYNFYKGRHLIRSVFGMAAGAIFLLLLKDYLFYTFIAALAVAFFYFKLLKNERPWLKYGFRALSVIGLIVFIFWYVNNSVYVYDNVFDSFKKKTEVLQNVTMQVNETEGGAGYTISNVDDTSPLGVLRSVAISLGTTYFRPFLWECRSPIMFLNALESFAVLLMVLYLLVKTKVVGFFTFAFSNHVLLFSFIYFILLGALVGFVSFNFGTLVRYKMPMVPLFYTYLILLYEKVRHRPQTVEAAPV